MLKQITIIFSIWALSFIVSSAFYIFKDHNNYFYFYILASMILASLNSILGYLIIRDFSMGINWKINENQFSDIADDYFGLCALCLKKANNYVIIFPEEYEYVEKNKL